MRFTVAMLGVVVLGVGVLPTSAASAEMNPPGESTSAVTDDGVAGGATEESAAAAPTPTGKAGLADLPVADAGDNEVRRPVVSVDIEQVTPGTQTVRSAFEYLIEYSCLSKLADCDGVVISVPFDQTTALAGGALPIAAWRAELISTNEQLVASDRYWDGGKNPRQIRLKTKLGAGSSSSVRIKLHPERGYVADGTTWEILPTIAANNAETSAAPVAVSSTVTASARLSGSLTFTDLTDHKDAGIGTQVLLKGVLAMPFAVGEAGGIFADPTKPFETVMIMPEGLDFVSSPQIPELASYDPLTRAFTFRPAHDADMASFAMLFQLGGDVEVGDEFTLRSTSVGTAIGADTELVADATATVTVVPNVLTSANRRWEVEGNGVPAYSRGFIAPSSESEELNFFNVSLEAQPRETVTELLIQLPCLSPRTPAAGSAWGVSVTCTQPLVNAKTLALEYWSDSKTVVSDAEPVDVTVTLTDGSTHVIQVGAEPVSLAQWEGKVVSAEASGVRLGPLDPSIEWWIDIPKAVF